MSTETRCEHCGRRIIRYLGRWVHCVGGTTYCLADTKASPSPQQDRASEGGA